MSERKQLNILMGERIRVAREAAGLTQENLADEIGVSGQFILILPTPKSWINSVKSTFIDQK